jgi:hypothetical protein
MYKNCGAADNKHWVIQIWKTVKTAWYMYCQEVKDFVLTDVWELWGICALLKCILQEEMPEPLQALRVILRWYAERFVIVTKKNNLQRKYMMGMFWQALWLSSQAPMEAEAKQHVLICGWNLFTATEWAYEWCLCCAGDDLAMASWKLSNEDGRAPMEKLKQWKHVLIVVWNSESRNVLLLVLEMIWPWPAESWVRKMGELPWKLKAMKACSDCGWNPESRNVCFLCWRWFSIGLENPQETEPNRSVRCCSLFLLCLCTQSMQKKGIGNRAQREEASETGRDQS